MTQDDHETGSSGNGTSAANGNKPVETLLHDVPLELTVELGRVTLTVRELATRLGPGSVIGLSKLTGEKLDIRVNQLLVARGEAVAVGDRYGIRITELIGLPRSGRTS
jgi:flagellar motor switch protein FliN/FliY